MKPNKNAPTLIDKRQFGLWKAFLFSFFSLRVYVDVAKNWTGIGLSYLLVMLVAATLLFGVRFEWAAYQFLKDNVIQPLKKLPSLTIEHGEVRFDHFMPYRIVNPSGDAVAIIDTTGVIRDIDHHQNPHLTWLITRNAILFYPPDLTFINQFQISFKDSKHIEILDEDDNGALDLTMILDAAWFKILIYGGILMVYPCVIAMFVSFIGVFFAAFSWAVQFYVRALFRYRLDYCAIYRLLVLALTPSLFLCFGLAGLGFVFPEGPLYYFILFALYFNLGVLAVRRADRALVFA